jgi:hypothetical protein
MEKFPHATGQLQLMYKRFAFASPDYYRNSPPVRRDYPHEPFQKCPLP